MVCREGDFGGGQDRLPNLIGLHTSIQKGYVHAVEEARAVGATTFQIFTRNQRQWREKEVSVEEGEAFRRAVSQARLYKPYAHAIYLLNLASPDDGLYVRSVQALEAEVRRCAVLGLEGVVVHPGSHRGKGASWGWSRVLAGVRRVLAVTSGLNVAIVLENTAGQGQTLGAHVEELLEVLQELPSDRTGLCLDTCHLWSAGYDFASEKGWRWLLARIEATIGLERLHVWHLNDSATGLGSRRDRHAHLGFGSIPEEGFRRIVQEFPHVPKIIETPRSPEWDRRNIAWLWRLAGRGGAE